MAGTSKKIAAAAVEQFGRTWAEELGIDLAGNKPQGLYQLLVFATLASARIRHQAAVTAAAALFDQGWTTAEKMTRTTWEQRVKVLNKHGYARYDESTSRVLGWTAQMLLDKYGGDLRKLRQAARRDVTAERRLLKECKGIGDVGVDIFFREVQVVWNELFPFADELALKAAGTLGLGSSAEAMLKLVGPQDYPRLVAALVRIHLEKHFEDVRRAA